MAGLGQRERGREEAVESFGLLWTVDGGTLPILKSKRPFNECLLRASP